MPCIGRLGWGLREDAGGGALAPVPELCNSGLGTSEETRGQPNPEMVGALTWRMRELLRGEGRMRIRKWPPGSCEPGQERLVEIGKGYGRSVNKGRKLVAIGLFGELLERGPLILEQQVRPGRKQ